MKKILIMMALMALTACSGPEAPAPGEIPMPEVHDGRVRVERIATFKDDIAYHGTRGVYVIRDKDTGKEFIGVSGIGVTEVGRHSSGKTTVADER